jgi:hypothetical protein
MPTVGPWDQQRLEFVHGELISKLGKKRPHVNALVAVQAPRPGDLRLAVEISDTTLGFDLTTKAELYARAGIVEYWVVDVAAAG